MRVLLLSDWNTNRGGAERYIVSLRDKLRSLGDEALLVSCSARRTDTSPSDARVYGSDFPPAQALLQIANPVASSAIRRQVRAFRPDVALVSQFAYHLSPIAVDALNGVPVIITSMDYKSICPLGTRTLSDGTVCTHRAGASCRTSNCLGFTHWVREIPRYTLIRRAVARADRVLCPSEWMRHEFMKQGVNAELMPLGVDAPADGFIHSPTAHPSFVYCGRLSAEKGVMVLLRAFAKFVADVPHASLTFAGDGPLRGALEKAVTQFHLDRSVRITGWISPERVEEELRTAWALVAPSLWAEPFGLAVVEAITRGVPVIASNSGAFTENVENDVTGILIEPGSEPALIQALRRIAMRTVFPSGGIDSSDVARARHRFSLDDHVDRMRALFREVVQSNRASA